VVVVRGAVAGSLDIPSSTRSPTRRAPAAARGIASGNRRRAGERGRGPAAETLVGASPSTASTVVASPGSAAGAGATITVAGAGGDAANASAMFSADANR